MMTNAPNTADTPLETSPTGNAWAALVEQIRQDDPAGMEELYRVFYNGVRLYLWRHLGPRDLDDRVHDMFLTVAQAVRRGDVREPERLMGFVYTIVRRQVAGHIQEAVQYRSQVADVDVATLVHDRRCDPEATAIANQHEELAMQVLQSISRRDRDILVRFYLREETQEQICREMNLTETQFRLIKSRAKARFGEMGRRRLERKRHFQFL